MNRMLPAVLIALCALMGIALAFQRSALNDARREQEELAARLDRVEAKQKEAVARKQVEELQEQVKSAEKKAVAATAAAEAAAKRPAPAPAPAAAPATLEDDIEKIVEAKLEEKIQKKNGKNGGLGEDRKMPIFDLAKELSLDANQQTRVTAIANTAKKEIFDILKTPRPDGGNAADDLLNAFTSGDTAAVQKVFGKLITDKIPGTDTLYITAVGRVQEKANQGLSVAMGSEAYSKYQGMNLKPENIETGFDPWIDHLQQRGK